MLPNPDILSSFVRALRGTSQRKVNRLATTAEAPNYQRVLRTRIACEYMHARFLRVFPPAIFKRPESFAHVRRLDGFHLMMIHVFLIHFG